VTSAAGTVLVVGSAAPRPKTSRPRCGRYFSQSARRSAASRSTRRRRTAEVSA
jgi:hypothetical protein